MAIYDPTCGSGGMLIQSHQYVQETGGNARDLELAGQESSGTTWAICKMNMLLHGIRSASIRQEDTLIEPKHIDTNGEIRKFDRVIANPPFSQNYSTKDMKYKYRFEHFMPESGKKADLMFVQHMVASLKSDGKLAVVMPHGVLFRGGKEKDCRKWFIQDGLLEAVIGLPANLFYGTGIPACVLVINRQGAAARQNVLFIKRFGYLLAKAKNRYKDDTLSISVAGEKVRALISEHLISLGIDPKIRPVELLSPQFMQELEKHRSPQAKASEMEHAIRKHCKVHLEEDPVLYRNLSAKLDALIQQFKDNWEALCKKLFDLQQEAVAGRQDDADPKAGPFIALIGELAFGKAGTPTEHQPAVRELVDKILGHLQRTIGIINFWNNAPEVGRLQGQVSDLLIFSGIDAIADKSDEIVTEVTALAKVRHKDLVG